MNIKLKALRLFFRLAILYWVTWSKVFRWFQNRRYGKTSLQYRLHHIDLLAELKTLTWTKDGPAELWDACGSPHWVQHALNEIARGLPQPSGGLDCDDFTAWAVHVVDPAYTPLMLQVAWTGKDGEARGHVVALLRSPRTMQYFHVGNWGMSGFSDSVDYLVLDILSRAGAESLIGWSLITKDLRLVRIETARG